MDHPTFSEKMDRDTLTNTTVILENAKIGATVGAVVSCKDPSQTVTIDPSETLAKRTRYTVTIEGGDGGVKMAAGEAMAADKAWSFTTGRR